MELRYRREVLVGMMIVGAALGFVLLMLWLKGKSLRTGEVVTVTFGDVMGLKVGDQVRTSGVLVGSVQEIELDSVTARVRVLMDIKKGPRPRSDARFTVKALDLLGARYVDYAPGTSPTVLPEGAVIEGVSGGDTDLSEIATSVAGQSRQLIANATEFLGPRMAAELRGTLSQAQRTLEALERAGTRPSNELVAALGDVRRLSQRMDILLSRTTDPAANTVRNMETVSANMMTITRSLTRTAASLDTLMVSVNRSRGVAGALINDTTLLAEIVRTNRALGDLLVDLKANPGRYLRLRL
jgi:phospholipid/cholesterol/gamma-HCH transport system substrate-binding protein